MDEVQLTKRSAPLKRRAMEALEQLRLAGVQVDALSPKERYDAVARWCGQKKLKVPSIDSVNRAAKQGQTRK